MPIVIVVSLTDWFFWMISLQVSHLFIFTVEAERNVCNVHVGCPVATGS